MTRILALLAALLMALTLGACATPGSSAPPEVRTGVIEQIKPTELKGDHDIGLGAVLGGVAGAGLGSLIGGGTGRDVAIALGAIGGAFAGNYAQNRYERPVAGEEIIVRLQSGVLIVVTQPVAQPLRVGQKVYVEGSGQNARVVPQ
jgi:outer membrane lipoprotein SlyB